MNFKTMALILHGVCLFGFAQQAAPIVETPETRLFGVILLQGANQPDANGLKLPEKTLKILEDVSSFLPYKHYKLLDSSFIRTDFHASFKLSGPSNKSLATVVGIEKHPGKTDTLRVNFRISPIPETAEEKAHHNSSIHLIDTSFSIKIGETIVVGTSKISNDEEAIIVLFSAA